MTVDVVTKIGAPRSLKTANGLRGQPSEVRAEPIGLSDDELALLFSQRHADELRYVPAWDRWLVWDGSRWAHDERRQVFDMARALCREILAKQLDRSDLTPPQRDTLRHRFGSASTIWAVVKLAGSDSRHTVAVDQLDADPWMLNTPAGTFDLRTGTPFNHDPSDLFTKCTAASPVGDCPMFLAMLERVLPDREVRDYMQRLAGYALTGSCREHALAFLWGAGRNGKSTLAHVLRRALGDYAVEIAPDVFMESHHEQHPTHLAVLRGVRFAVAAEIDSGRRWNESRLKRLTGGDPISARYIGRDLFEFEPTHTLVIVGNAKPGLRSVDEAMRARLHLVEFGVTIPADERDTALPERLSNEYGGILRWAIAGCLEWQKQGLNPPAAVRAATATYLEGEDMLTAWIDECCERTGQVTLQAAHKSFCEWCERNGAFVLGRNNFRDQLEARGFKKDKESRSRKPIFVGLSLPVPASWNASQ